MPDGPFMTPEEGRMMRMMLESGSPADAARDLISRLEQLEAAVAELESAATQPAAEPAEKPHPTAPEA